MRLTRGVGDAKQLECDHAQASEKPEPPGSAPRLVGFHPGLRNPSGGGTGPLRAYRRSLRIRSAHPCRVGRRRGSGTCGPRPRCGHALPGGPARRRPGTPQRRAPLQRPAAVPGVPAHGRRRSCRPRGRGAPAQAAADPPQNPERDPDRGVAGGPRCRYAPGPPGPGLAGADVRLGPAGFGVGGTAGPLRVPGRRFPEGAGQGPEGTPGALRGGR
ncbi:MAG: hypothetical protein BWY56_02548 [Acidobacteria bacterium ADurb.Bin340]|nr:MAG: hypothetical protein BWY56_02548 [Acidobacteria bacterium ADurb.Bin340]